MASSKTNPHEFIRETFAPMVAVATSPGVDEVCKKNNLEFVTLIKPFSKSTVEGFMKDPSGAVVTVQPRICFCDINSRPPPLNIARSYFNEALSSHIYERTTTFKAGNLLLDIPQSTPWFDAWRNAYLQVQYPSDHEFTKHYIGCLIMVSSLDASPVEQVARISQDVTDLITQTNNKLPKWFGPLSSILITYGFLHDNSCGLSSTSMPAFEAMKATYGSQKCFFITTNSQNPEIPMKHVPDPWLPYKNSIISYKENQQEPESSVEVESAQEAGEKPSTPVIVHPLSPVTDDPNIPTIDAVDSSKNASHGVLISNEDIAKIIQFVNDFCSKALIPHFEQLIQSFTDQISTKKGVSRSLFSATKRLFGTNKPGAPGNQMPPTAISYSSDSHELQLRKLGDLCFMIGIYMPAYNAYHSAKRDFHADSAWLHYAGALEMAALAAFMTDNHQLFKKMIEYSEESISTYPSCRYNPFATRATLLSSECLKGKGLHGEAAKQLIRMSGEDSDLRSAVLLEQAAYCFLHSPRSTMFRKYAFHMVLAGNRYSKASHKNHSMRCYYQAHQVYESKNWSIAEDHILYTIGKHASTLKLNKNSFEALSILVKRSSRQIPVQQTLYFKDYLSSVENMIADGDEGILSIPVVDGKLIQILLNVTSDDFGNTGRITASGIAYNKSLVGNYLDDSIWAKLEEKLVNFASSATVFVFVPTVGILNDRTKNALPSVIVAGEPVGIRILLKNPLHIPISMTNVALVWSHTPSEPVAHGYCAAVSSNLPELTMQPDSSRHVMMMLTPTSVGDLQVTALKYTLHESGTVVEGIQRLIPVPHLSHETDQRLSFKVIGQAPLLHVSFSGLKKEMFVGEIVPITVHLRNDGAMEISQVLLTCSSNFELHIPSVQSRIDGTVFDLGVTLLPHETRDLPIKLLPSWLERSGTQVLNMLFYYTNKNFDVKPKYRLVRHSWPTEVLKPYNTKVSATRYESSSVDNCLLNIAVAIKSALMNQYLSESIEIYSFALLSHIWMLSSTSFQPADTTLKKNEDLFILIGASRVRQPSSVISTLSLTDCSSDIEPKCSLPRLKDPLQSENDMLLIINWRYHRPVEGGGSETAFGQDYCRLSVGREQEASKPKDPPSEMAKRLKLSNSEQIIDYRLLHESFVENNQAFVRSRALVLSATLKLLNRSSEPQCVKILANRSQSKSTQNTIRSSSWRWQGKGLYEFIMQPNEDSTIPLEAAIYKRGTYNLVGGINVMVKIGDEFVLQNDPLNSSVVIVK